MGLGVPEVQGAILHAKHSVKCLVAVKMSGAAQQLVLSLLQSLLCEM